MAGTTLDIEGVIDPHTLAVDISSRWTSWNNARSEKIKEWQELRNYVYATDTRTTSNNKSVSYTHLTLPTNREV